MTVVQCHLRNLKILQHFCQIPPYHSYLLCLSHDPVQDSKNRNPDIVHPILTPYLIVSRYDVTLLSTTAQAKPMQMPPITLAVLSGIPFLLMIFHRLSMCT